MGSTVAGKRAYPQPVRPPVVTLRPTTPKPNKSHPRNSAKNHLVGAGHLTYRRLNGRAVAEWADVLAYLRERYDRAPVHRGGKRRAA
jgi:hypothetical protein